MPPPPSRVFAPLEEEPLVSSPVAEAPVAAPRVPSTTPPARRATAPPETEKPAPAPAPAPAAEPPRELRAASSPADNEAERRITEVLRSATRDLNRVDYRGLTRGGRESYDQAKGFIDEAEKALTARNFIYAQTAADKAAKLASELGR
jgi:2-oxoglutarate dehydrogenase E2 component (dihydrolipoamide succinyltransferase)